MGSLAQESPSSTDISPSFNGKDRDLPIHRTPMNAKTLDQLPPETLQNIIGYVNWNDLLNIQTLSRQFHRLASTAIYRNLDFNITSSEGDDNGDIASRAADALQAINTSDYDYAQHIKTFRLGLTYDNNLSHSGLLSSIPDLMASVVFDSKSDSSKFLNTSILLVIRRASILESFNWDLPLEMSGAVYQALQKIPSLRHLRVRMDIRLTPRLMHSRLPYTSSHPPPPPNPGQPPPPHNHSSVIVPSMLQPYTPANKGQSVKRKKSRGSTFWSNRRSFSGFNNLKTLEIIRLMNLECLGEISQCIKASAAALKSLTVTLDTELVGKAQKSASAPLSHDLDDLSNTELEDELLLESTSPVGPASQPANEADIRQEKSAQEGILARLFDLESLAPKGKKLERKLGLTGGKCLKEERHAALDSELKVLLKSMTNDNGLSSSNYDPAKLEKLQNLRRLADLYISEHSVQPRNISSPEKSRPSPAKKSHKPPKPKGPKFPPHIPASSNFDPKWDEFFDENYKAAMSSPMSAEFGAGGLSSKPAGFLPYNSSSLPHLAPPAQQIGGASSSFDLPALPYSEVTSSSVDIQPPLPYYGSTKKSKANMQPSYFGSDLPPYFSPYTPSSYKKSLVKHPAKSLSSSGTQTPSIIDKYDAFIGSHTYEDSPLSPSIMSTNKHSSKGKGLQWQKKTGKSSVTISSPTSGDESDTPPKTEPISKAPFFAAEATTAMTDNIDVDIDHPDEDQLEFGDDQQSASASDGMEVQTPRKRLKPLEDSRVLPVMADGGSSSSSPFRDQRLPKATHTDEMHEYIRATHGLQLEDLRLHYVPMKASIIGKALDLTVLRHVTLLETGPQDAFWTLLVKLGNSGTPISFKSIHTDNVTFAFLKYVASFEGLEELFMHERKLKNNDTDPEAGVNIDSIREEVLRRHGRTLKRLMLRNERNAAWDVDLKTLHMLAIHAHALEELAVNMKSSTYHGLLQIFPAFKTLRALQIIILRGSDRAGLSSQLESLTYTIDSLAHCPELNIRYIAIQDLVTEISGHKQFRKHLRRMMEIRKPDPKGKGPDKKGKGKAVDAWLPDGLNEDDAEMNERIANVQAAQRKMRSSRKFDEVGHVKIFSVENRLGKLL